MIDLRLRAYAPNGASLGVLPDALELQAGLPLSETSSLSVKYSRLVAGGSVLVRDLGAGLELGVEHSTPSGTWAEPKGGRFLVLKRGFDAADETDTVSLTCPGYMWQLRKARVEKAAGVDLVDGKRAFLTATAGMILGALIDEAQARGEITGVTKSFTSALDSAGQPWASVITIYYEPGLDIWSVLDNLSVQGVCDWSAQGRELQVYNPDTALAVDRTTGASPLDLRLGRDLTAAPSDESIEELISRAVLRGDNGLLLVEDNPSAPTPWGIWTGTISQGGVSDEGTARTLAQADLARGARVRGQYTRELVLPTTAHDPLVAYAPGDYVMAPGPSRSLERLRVRQITLTKNSDGVTGNVVLNDRVIEAELRRARRMSGIVGGATSDGGSGARPTPPGDDRRVPQAPAGLVAASDAYIDAAGLARAQVTLTWAPATTATDGTPLDKVSYVVWIRPAVVGEEWRTLLTTSATTVSTSPFDVGSVHELRVQAVNEANARAGALGAVVEVTMEADTTPPPVPSAPILTSSMGTITVVWDGKTSTGTAMPRDFERVEMRQGVPGTPGPVVATLRATSGQAFVVITGAGYDIEHMFAFRAVDRSGNASDWSTSATSTVARLVDADLIGTTIDDQITAARQVADEAQTTANGRNRVTYAAAAPAAGDVGTVLGDTWFQRDGSGSIVGQWEWTALGWVARSIESAMIANLDAGKITTGFLAGARIEARSITAEKVLIGGPGANLLPDPRVSTLAAYARGAGITQNPTGGRNGGGAFAVTSTAAIQDWNTATTLVDGVRPYLVPAQGGRRYVIEAAVRSSVAVAAAATHLQLIRFFYDSAGASLGSGAMNIGLAVPADTWTTVRATTPAAPDGTAYIRIGGRVGAGMTVGALVEWSDPACYLAVDNALVVDGSITARALAAGAVEADKIAANAVTADSIRAGAITGTKIAADAIDGKTITGATVRTAETGARVVLDALGLDVYDDDNTLVATYGPLTTGGVPNGAGLLIQKPTSGDDIFIAKYDAAGKPFVLMGQGGKPLERLHGWADSITLISTKAGGELLLETTNASAFFRGKTANVEALGGGLLLKAAGGWADVQSNVGVNINSTVGDAFFQAARQVQIKSGLKQVYIDHNTAPASANCHITEAGLIYRSTSSRRYKQDVEDLVVDVDQVLAMRPRTWRDRAEVERDPDTTNRYLGFVAEELVDVGLEAFVVYNEAGEVDAIAYDRLTAALVPVLQHQQRQLDEQAATLAALAAKVEALEGAA